MMRPLVLSIALLAAHAACAQDALVLRSYEAAPAGDALDAGPQGIRVRTEAGVVVVGWDRVLRAPSALGVDEAQLARGRAIWRARTRVERGDRVLAEPILERLFAEPAARTGPTRLVVAEGLLRCRLARGATAAAVEPWLAWLDASAVREPNTAYAGRDWSARAGLAGVTDDATELCPQLPPMWLGTTAAPLVLGLEPIEGERAKTAALRRLYQASLEHELGRSIGELPEANRDDGVALVREIVAARAGDDAERNAARAKLGRRLESARGWRRAWVLAGLGRSLVAEDDRESRLRGVARLLRVNLLHRRHAPTLADIALAEAAVVLDRLGENDAARRLAADLQRRHSDASVLAWPPLADLLDATAADPRPAGGSPQ
ncbi:MAG: hypothetical protein AAFX79_07315 [Planctomycetota bacterium]